MELTEENLTTELENVQSAMHATRSGKPSELLNDSKFLVEDQEDTEASKSDLAEKLEEKKRELVCSNIFLI